MPLSSRICILALLALAAACTRATFTAVQDGGDEDASIDEPQACPAPTKPACTEEEAPSAPCDPVCQTGACQWCSEKCTKGGDGTTTCGKLGTRKTGEACTITYLGEPRQYDDCIPGDICLPSGPGFPYSYCLTLCRDSRDCPDGVACSPRPIGMQSGPSAPMAKVCDPPYTACNAASNPPCCDPIHKTGCPLNRFCYLVSPDPGSGDSRTVCDFTTGITTRDPCSSSRDCAEGFGCAVTGFCQQVCDPTVADPCGGGPCSLSGSGSRYGYCP